MPATITRTARSSRPVADPRATPARPTAHARPGRLEVPDLELLLDAIGDREDRAGADERARLHRIRGQVELALADRLTE